MPNKEKTSDDAVAEGVEHVAQAVEQGARIFESKEKKGHSDLNEVRGYAFRNLVAIVGIASTLFGAAFGMGGSHLVNQYRLSEIEKTQINMEVESKERYQILWTKFSYLNDHGRDEDQRRMTALEQQKSGELALVVAEQGRQIVMVTRSLGELTSAMKTDHDALTRILVILEKKHE